MYRLYWNQAAATYSSLYFLILLSLQLSNIKMLHHTFLRNYETCKIETWYTNGQLLDVSCIQELGCWFYLSVYFFIFLSFQFSVTNLFFSFDSTIAGLKPNPLTTLVRIRVSPFYQSINHFLKQTSAQLFFNRCWHSVRSPNKLWQGNSNYFITKMTCIQITCIQTTVESLCGRTLQFKQ